MKKNKYFIELPRHKRKKECIRLKNKLNGKNFYTPFDLSHDIHAWFDIFFLSKKDKCTFYSAVLTSSRLALFENISDKAHEETEIVFPYYENNEQHNEYINKKIIEFLKSDLSLLYENIEINYAYSYGVELFATFKDEFIASKRVDEFVQEFWDNGEQEYCSDIPIQFSKSCIDNLIDDVEKGRFW